MFLGISAFAETIPDYSNPYAPIFTDKEVYTWTDKIRITIVAPSWNADRNGIDSIGEQEGHLIKISTSANSKEIVIPPSLFVSINPFVGPFPRVLGFVSKSPSPSTSCKNPVRITSPVKVPLLGPVSVNLYGSNSLSDVEILIKCPSWVPIESIPFLFC